jgi:hypothetical protein
MVRRILLICGIVSSVLYIAVDILATLRYPGYRYTADRLINPATYSCQNDEREYAVE